MNHLTFNLFFILIFIYTAFTHATIAGQNTVKKYINFSMITIAYHKNFPYKKSYDKNLIPGCKKIYTNKPLLYCKEYVQLMRPVTLIKKWQNTQKKMGYLPITLPEFNIFNVASKIISIIPAATYSKYLLSETNSTGHMVTGKFIRHSDKVGHYMFTTGKDSAIDNINATDNHLFYVKNKNKFIPVSKIQPADSLINKEGKTVRLKHTVNSRNRGEKLTDKPPETVYNLEISSNHTYFIGSHNILVHNTCLYERYFKHLSENNLICVSEDSGYIYLKFSKKDKIKFCSFTGDKGIYMRKYLSSGIVPESIRRRLRRMGFISATPSRESDVLVLAAPMPRLEYEAILPYINSQKNDSVSSKSILEAAMATYVKETATEAYLEKRCDLYRSILAVLTDLYVARGVEFPNEGSVLPGQQAYEDHFHGLNNEELQSVLDEKRSYGQTIRKTDNVASLVFFQRHK